MLLPGFLFCGGAEVLLRLLPHLKALKPGAEALQAFLFDVLPSRGDGASTTGTRWHRGHRRRSGPPPRLDWKQRLENGFTHGT